MAVIIYPRQAPVNKVREAYGVINQNNKSGTASRTSYKLAVSTVPDGVQALLCTYSL